ncbi:zinc finger MYM-type protein 5 [Trichonephila clavipes]|nr:zinc finger MYM-type protein 5 [Trichonephila clavipes]
MRKFLKKPSTSVTASESSGETLVYELASESNESFIQSSDTVLPATSGESAMIQMSEPNKELESEMMCDSENQVQGVHLRESFIDLDPGKWAFPVNYSQRHDLVQNGPNQDLEKSDESYPKDSNKRHFSKFHFTRKLSDGETQHRRWLVYSIFQDKVYCFPCRLFSHLQTQVVKGCCDRKDLSLILQRHEQSQGHMECMIKWMEFYKGIKHGKTIDKDNERLIKESRKYWYNLFERMIDIINYLASHNLSFSAHRESLKLNDSRHSGNFIDLFKVSDYFRQLFFEKMEIWGFFCDF